MLENNLGIASKFSEAEERLIRALGYEWVLEPVSRGSIPEPKVYDLMALEVFAENKKGPTVDALRRVLLALRNCKLYRHTDEFDQLCSFTEEEG